MSWLDLFLCQRHILQAVVQEDSRPPSTRPWSIGSTQVLQCMASQQRPLKIKEWWDGPLPHMTVTILRTCSLVVNVRFTVKEIRKSRTKSWPSLGQRRLHEWKALKKQRQCCACTSGSMKLHFINRKIKPCISNKGALIFFIPNTLLLNTIYILKYKYTLLYRATWAVANIQCSLFDAILKYLTWSAAYPQ